MDQTELDSRNADFWSFLCGSHQAKLLGVHDSSLSSLKIFDDWYMEMYPYLVRHIPFSDMAGKRVLEIGLGYGTISQKIAEAGADYCGLDISSAAVAMANDRMRQCGFPQNAVCGNVLNAPFEDNTMDIVISIGCLHHTGNLQRALDEVRRILKPGGVAVVMVYNALSYRRWYEHTEETQKYFDWQYLGDKSRPDFNVNALQAYDTNDQGECAPDTAFVSVSHMKRMCSGFSRFSATLENIAQEPPYADQTREALLKTKIPSVCGLDLYATMSK